jgi:hypothetical protein
MMLGKLGCAPGFLPGLKRWDSVGIPFDGDPCLSDLKHGGGKWSLHAAERPALAASKPLDQGSLGGRKSGEKSLG